ncbi:MAG TPA: glycosyltransferase family 4 protein [Solirubrobacteraceae bacterium]|nr:glycosyltransferase family 4 protein [Solirubrobacteraceae bacterium]
MSRRFALVVVHELLPVQLGKDPGLIPLGLRDRGWEVELHAPSGSGEGWPFPVHVAPLSEMASPGYWAPRGIDGAVVYSFFRHGPIIRALAAGGARVIGKGDTDGFLAPRLHAWPTLEIALHHRAGPTGKALQLANWLGRVGPLHRRELDEIRDAVGSSHAFVVESEPARRRVAGLLRRYGPAQLAERLRVVPIPIAPVFTRGDVAREREPLVVAAGRWDDPQKNGPLMARALRRFLDAHPGWRAHVVGARAQRLFGGERVDVTAQMPREELAALFGRARIVASSSRFEAAALAVHEGLACGCTIATTPLAPFEHVVAQGPFGTLAAERRPLSRPGAAAALAGALEREAAAWDAGERDPVAVAAFWRAAMDVDAVAVRFEELLA